MKELILSPEEIYYIGKVSGGKYLDYDYIAAMKDIGKRGKIKQQEILDSLERKGYAQEDFLGNLEVEPACIEVLKPLYQGMYESELICGKRPENLYIINFIIWRIGSHP